MFRLLVILSLVWNILPLSLAFDGDFLVPEICEAITVLNVQTHIVYSSIVINEYFSANTAININGIVININNAPTQLNTTVTATVTSTQFVTTPEASSFILEAVPVGMDKRQNEGSGFVGTGGTRTSCSLAVNFDLLAGRLFSNSSEVSTSPNVTSMSFEAGTSNNEISTTFGLLNSVLFWKNESFVGGEALFCLNAAGVVEAYFNGSTPMSCTLVNLLSSSSAACSSLSSASPSSLSGSIIVDSTTSSMGSRSVTSSTSVITDVKLSSAGNPSGASNTISTSTTSALSTSTSSHSSSVSSSSTQIVPTVVLPQPTAIYGDVVNGAPANVDDNSTSIVLPFEIQMYDHSSSTIYVSTNGVLMLDVGSSAQTNTQLPNDLFNGNEQAYDTIPSYSACIFWDDTYIYKGTMQGIYYEVDGTTVIFEYYLSHFRDSTQYYHYLVDYNSTNPGVFTINYLEVSDHGVSATVGIQGDSGTLDFIQYSYNTADITPGLILQIDTVMNTAVVISQ